MTLGYAGRMYGRIKDCRSLLPPCVHLCRIIYSFNKFLLNISTGQGTLPGRGNVAVPGSWALSFPLAGSGLLILNHDSDWPLLYSSLVGAVASGQLLHFARVLGYFPGYALTHSRTTCFSYAWGIDKSQPCRNSDLLQKCFKHTIPEGRDDISVSLEAGNRAQLVRWPVSRAWWINLFSSQYLSTYIFSSDAPIFWGMCWRSRNKQGKEYVPGM